MGDMVWRAAAAACVWLVLSCCAAPSRDVDSELGVGKAINIFMRYGYLSICMRVVPRNDTEGWVFREPTVSVFRDIGKYQLESRPRQSKAVFNGDFHMEFCDNLKQLLQAYFRDFSFERLERPWRAFTAGWPTDIMARNLGINSSFITGDHCYVLVRVSRFREIGKLRDLPSGVGVEDVVFEAIQQSDIGDTVGTSDFIRKYGSHYISSYVTGNSLYQVFVFNRGAYLRIKEQVKSNGVAKLAPADLSSYFSPIHAEHVGIMKVFVFSRTAYAMIKERLKSKGVSDIGAKELEGFFSPWHAKHIGQVKVASGNKTVENWAAKKLRVHYYIFSYPSLLKLHGEPTLLKSLDNLLGNEALLQLELKTLAPAFKDMKKRKWFEEVIDNFLKLWESNM